MPKQKFNRINTTEISLNLKSTISGIISLAVNLQECFLAKFCRFCRNKAYNFLGF